ncbi:GAF domain-containing protein [Actinoplanes sp. NPDC049802]|uniref:GAF domain-containing protein n=1 Tax=Actinoplanes sp. NPDC049802 TaxID=3154742 RepID=UPI0033C42082
MDTHTDHLSQLGDPRRMRVLASIDLENADLRDRLDSITERTAQRLGLPISLVTLVLDTAQFLAGSHGVTGWVAESRGTPVEWSFCARAVHRRGPYVIVDASADPDHATNPMVAFEGVRSYAGVPLELDGQFLGAHCVVGGAAHTFTDDDISELRRAADEIVALLDRYRIKAD